jgi:hypothetical protein
MSALTAAQRSLKLLSANRRERNTAPAATASVVGNGLQERPMERPARESLRNRRPIARLPTIEANYSDVSNCCPAPVQAVSAPMKRISHTRETSLQPGYPPTAEARGGLGAATGGLRADDILDDCEHL